MAMRDGRYLDPVYGCGSVVQLVTLGWPKEAERAQKHSWLIIFEVPSFPVMLLLLARSYPFQISEDP